MNETYGDLEKKYTEGKRTLDVEFLQKMVTEEMLNMFHEKLKHIENLVSQHPNDYDLGGSVRSFVNDYKNKSNKK